MHLATHVLAIDFPTRVPKGPAGDTARTLYIGRVGLEEVEGVDWAMVDGSSQEGKQDEQASTGDEDEGQQA